MQDRPAGTDILRAVSEFLRKEVMPQLPAHTAFHARVAANALDLVAREVELGPVGHAAEHERLRALLGEDATLKDLNAELCARIEGGEFDLRTPGLVEHLWATTLEKLAVDQPRYASYRRALEERSDPRGESA